MKIKLVFDKKPGNIIETLEITEIKYFQRTNLFVVKAQNDWSGTGGTIDLAILDLCRTFEREHHSGETG